MGEGIQPEDQGPGPDSRALKAFEPLHPAERRLLAAYASGDLLDIDRARPERMTDENLIRAEIIVILATATDAAVPANPKGVGIRGAWIEGTVQLRNCKVIGSLIFMSCVINGRLDLNDADVHNLLLPKTSVKGITAGHLNCRGSLNLSDGFHSTAKVSLSSAKIGGDLDCRGSQFDDPRGDALDCGGAEVAGNVWLHAGFVARGEVTLSLIQIRGVLFCGGLFENPRGQAVACYGASIGGELLMGGEFKAKGGVWLANTSVGGDFGCSGGSFDNPGGKALNCNGLKIRGSFFARASRITGTLDLTGAQIGGDLTFVGGVFGVDAGNGAAIDLSRSRIGGSIIFGEVKGHLTTFRLRGTYANALIDDGESWLRVDEIVFDGFEYDRFLDWEFGDSKEVTPDDKEPVPPVKKKLVTPVDAATRIKWLNRQRVDHLRKNFKPQPWDQLIKVLRAMGHFEQARIVAVAKQRQLRAAGKFPGLAGLFHGLYGTLYGYGYQPTRLLVWLVVIWALCGVAFMAAANRGIMEPTSREIQKAHGAVCAAENKLLTDCPQVALEYGAFNPFIYSLDLIVPLASLQLAKDWHPRTVERCAFVTFYLCWNAGAAPATSNFDKVGYSLPGISIAFLARLESLFGWLAGLMFVAVASGLVKKD